MNLFFHRTIVLLLLLLQGVSPLVHAHVHADGGESGLHIDGISVLLEKDSQFTSLKTIGHSDAVMGMRSAIQHKTQLINDLPMSGFIGQYGHHFIQPYLLEKKVLLYSPPPFQNKLSTYLSIIAPRAPPFV